jgi:hypothetical protein
VAKKHLWLSILLVIGGIGLFVFASIKYKEAVEEQNDLNEPLVDCGAGDEAHQGGAVQRGAAVHQEPETKAGKIQ